MTNFIDDYLSLLLNTTTNNLTNDWLCDFFCKYAEQTATGHEKLPSLLPAIASLPDSLVRKDHYAILREKELKKTNEALYKLSFLPQDLEEIAAKIQTQHKQLSDDLYKIIQKKKELISTNQTILNEFLPEIAFPATFSGKSNGAKYDFVLWGYFEIVQTQTTQTTPPNTPLIITLLNNLGLSVDKLGISIPLMSHKLPSLKGNSSSLACFTKAWLSLTGLKLKNIKIAITGEIKTNGDITQVNDINAKVTSALGAGFTYVVLPMPNLEPKDAAYRLSSKLRNNPKLIPVKNVFELIDWLNQQDPIRTSNQLLRGLFQNLLTTTSALTEEKTILLKNHISEQLIKDKFAESIWRLTAPGIYCPKILIKDYFKLYEQIFKLLKSLIYDYNNSKKRKIKNYNILTWVGIFKALLPNSIFLLHLPVILERYSSNFRIQAFNIYNRMIPDFAFHDMNLTHAHILSTPLFEPSLAAKWFDEQFRGKYPLLALFLFTDLFNALLYLSKSDPLLQEEKKWLEAISNEFVKELSGRKLFHYSQPQSNWEPINAAILTKALASTPIQYSPNSGNITSFEDRPLKIFKILNNLKKHNHKILNKKFIITAESLALNILKNLTTSKTPNTLCEEIIKSIQSKNLFPLRTEQKKLLPPKLYECYMYLLNTPPKPTPTANEYWSRKLANALSHKKGSLIVRKKINLIDTALNKALLGFLEAKTPLNKKSHLSFQFQCFVNPAWALICLILNHTKKSQAGELYNNQIAAMLQTWYDSVANFSGEQMLFRQLLVNECLYNFVGRLVIHGLLPQKAIPNKLKNRTAYLSAINTNKPSPSNELIKKLLNDINNNNFRCLIWLVQIQNTTQQDKFLKEILNQTKSQQANNKLVILIAFLKNIWKDSNEWKLFSPDLLKEADELINNFEKNPLSPLKNKSIIQGILPFAIFKKTKNLGSTQINKLCMAIAGSIGFSPMALCLLNPELTAEDPFKFSQWWELTWEREIFITLYITYLFLEHRHEHLDNLIRHSGIDLKNIALLCKLRKSTKMKMFIQKQLISQPLSCYN